MTQCEEDEEWGGRRGEKEEEKKNVCAWIWVCVFVYKKGSERNVEINFHYFKSSISTL